MKINSDIFKEYDIRAKYPEEISDESAYLLGLAFAQLTGAKKIVIGRDKRAESELVYYPLMAGLVAGGLKIYDLGVCATPELFFAVGAKKFPCGVMITASHSPIGQTGFKFCDGQGKVYGLKTGLLKLQKLAEKLAKSNVTESVSAISSGKIEKLSIKQDYQKFVLSLIELAELKNLKIVLDASSGSGANLAEAVFKALPLKKVLVNFKSGDKYPDHGLNPLLPENQKVISAAVKKERADLGVVFDGDADRSVFFDETGKFIEPYYLNCLLAQIVLSKKKGIKLAVDARLNLAISEVIKNAGGQVLVQRSGYANFINTMSAKKLLFGCENSGHAMYNFAWRSSRQFVYGDAIIQILFILQNLNKKKIKLSEAIKPFTDSYKISGELNFPAKNFDALAVKIKKTYSSCKISELDGVSVWSKNSSWFFNVRPSHTEPLVRVNIEAKDDVTVELVRKKLEGLIV